MKIKNSAKPKPKEGDTKEKIKFALFPTKVEDKWVWLEKYIAVYEYKKYYYTHDVVVSSGIFTDKYYTRISEAIGWVKTYRKQIN